MPVPFYRNLRKGMRQSARDTNAMVRALNANAPISGGYDGAKADPCMFYTADDIPPYSIFPLAGWMQNRVNTLETCFLIEQYDAAEGIYYDGYFGTNGPYQIKGGTAFIGHLVEYTVDMPVVIDGYDVSKGIYCGFKDGSWEATQDADGLIITGKCPFGSNIYFARKSQSDCCDKLQNDRFACLETELTAGGSVTAKEWETGEEFTVYASPLLCPGESIEPCSMVQASWFPQYEKWYVVAVGGTCNCDCGSGSDHSDSSDRSDQPDRSDSGDSSSGGQTIYAKIWYESGCVAVGGHYIGENSSSSEWVADYETQIQMYAYVDEEGEAPWNGLTLYADLGTFNDLDVARATVASYFDANRQTIIDWGRGLLSQDCGNGAGTLWAQGYDIPWGTTLIDYDYTNGSGGE